MSARIVRTATYKMLGQDREVRISKWSVRKFLTLFEVIGKVLGTIDQKLSLSDATDSKRLGSLLVALAQEAPDPVFRIVSESVEDPKLTKDELMEWDPEDLLGLLEAILKINLTDDLTKNGRGLRDQLFPAKSSS